MSLETYALKMYMTTKPGWLFTPNSTSLKTKIKNIILFICRWVPVTLQVQIAVLVSEAWTK